MKLQNTAGFLLFVGSTLSYAQQDLVGTYTGSTKGYLLTGKSEVQMGVRVEIKGVEGKILTGRMQQSVYWRCRGEGAAEGIFTNNKIIFWSVEEIGPAGCGRARYVGVVEGDSFVGKWGGAESTLSKSSARSRTDAGETPSSDKNPPLGNSAGADLPDVAPAGTAVTNVDAVPFLRKSGREGYEKFLTAKRWPRVFVLSEKGNWAWRSGPGAIQGALETCEKFGPKCNLYAVDDEVVWTAPVNSAGAEKKPL